MQRFSLLSGVSPIARRIRECTLFAHHIMSALNAMRHIWSSVAHPNQASHCAPRALSHVMPATPVCHTLHVSTLPTRPFSAGFLHRSAIPATLSKQKPKLNQHTSFMQQSPLAINTMLSATHYASLQHQEDKQTHPPARATAACLAASTSPTTRDGWAVNVNTCGITAHQRHTRTNTERNGIPLARSGTDSKAPAGSGHMDSLAACPLVACRTATNTDHNIILPPPHPAATANTDLTSAPSAAPARAAQPGTASTW